MTLKSKVTQLLQDKFGFVDGLDYVTPDTDTGFAIENFENSQAFNEELFNNSDEIAKFIQGISGVDKCEVEDIAEDPCGRVRYSITTKANTKDAITNQQLLLNFASGRLREILKGLDVTVYEGVFDNKQRVRVVPNVNEIPDEVVEKIKVRAKEFDGKVARNDRQIIITTDVAPEVNQESVDKNADTSLEIMDAKPLAKIDKEDCDFLIDDEEEAIDGYTEVLTRVKDKEQVKVLKSIIADEKRHIKMIKALLK